MKMIYPKFNDQHTGQRENPCGHKNLPHILHKEPYLNSWQYSESNYVRMPLMVSIGDRPNHQSAACFRDSITFPRNQPISPWNNLFPVHQQQLFPYSQNFPRCNPHILKSNFYLRTPVEIARNPYFYPGTPYLHRMGDLSAKPIQPGSNITKAISFTNPYFPPVSHSNPLPQDSRVNISPRPQMGNIKVNQINMYLKF